MILLDTDHISALQFDENAAAARLRSRLEALARSELSTSVITVEEQLRGWLAAIHSRTKPSDQVVFYERLRLLVRFFASWTVLPFDATAVAEFERLQKAKIRVGTMDLKIASIALSHGCTLLTANSRDFEKVPGLRIEDRLKA
jgi:tRNA(fMet)-specific endonuclease VapC